MRVARAWLHRLLGRFDRSAPAWLAWLPSWGTSLLLHAILLIFLATFFYATSPPREKSDFDSSIVSLADQDFQSLTPADRSGDPFADSKTDETPSISMDPSGKATGQPRLVAGLAFSPVMTIPDRTSTGRETGLSDLIQGSGLHAEDMTAPFAGRQGASKVQLIRREGGTTASERAVQDGLAWLMRHQRDDGGWSLDVRAECKMMPNCAQDAYMVSDTAATGMALLTFLGAGHIHNQPSRYQDQVKRGIDWLIAKQTKEGLLFLSGPRNSPFYSHAIASMALCEAYGISKDPRLAGPAQRAIDYIAQTQNKDDGGWRYWPGQEGDTSVFGWEMFALRSARLAGLAVSKNVIKGCVHYLDEAASDKNRTAYGYLPGRPGAPVMTAVGLLCRQYLGWQREHPPLVKGVAGVWNDLQASGERNIYYWYYATQLLHNMQNKAWKQWNVRVRDGLVATQIQSKGCDHGSWNPVLPQPDVWGASAGRLYQTSLSILTLEVYYRFLPLYRTSDAPVDPDAPKL